MIRPASLAALTLALALPAAAQNAGDVIRHPIPDSDFPIAQAIEIPAGSTRVLLSGTVPAPTDSSADPNSAAAYGDTEAQTVSVLNQIESKLQAMGLSMGDVVKMQVYLVAPQNDAPMDFAGFMKGYTQFFGTDTQTNLPTRSVFEVAGLANPGWLVEIEVEAVRP
ncbi:RidA family protein [Paracoccus sp. Z118]|uniref:RidA family protein n=1 Tax=Paracoccus sp. Z118 TaxID=2851017 RepID=UPI001C2C2647|nr:RidA family protein [Paracoccus sp. Z118]MBV0893383.1 RidA family protein [Paracoccus sp. Z118]